MRHRILATAFAVAMSFSPAIAMGHTPTVGIDAYDELNAEDQYSWGTGASATTWFKTQINLAGNGPASDHRRGNFAKSPTFSYMSSSPNKIHWTSSGCVGFAACVLYLGNGELNSITFNPSWNWCQYSGSDPDTCDDIRLAMVHELGHAAGLARGNTHQADGQSLTATVMQLNIPAGVPDPGAYKLGHCDTLELLREYDMHGYQNPLSRCVDHLPSTVQSGGKVITGTYLNGTAVSVCVGEPVTMSGSIQLVDEAADSELGALANNGLTSRTIRLYKRTSSGSYPGTAHATTTAAFVAGTFSFTVTNGSAGTYYYRADFTATSGSQDELTLNDDVSGEKQVTYRTSPC